MDPDLLRPSIGQAAPTRPLYSTTALFVPAFFGGPVAAAVIFALNAQRAQRFGQDVYWAVAGAALVVLAPWFALSIWQLPPEHLRYVMRGAGLLAAAGFAWRHRPAWHAQELFGVESPSGWKVGFVALLIGWSANVLVGMALLSGTLGK